MRVGPACGCASNRTPLRLGGPQLSHAAPHLEILLLLLFCAGIKMSNGASCCQVSLRRVGHFAVLEDLLGVREEHEDGHKGEHGECRG